MTFLRHVVVEGSESRWDGMRVKAQATLDLTEPRTRLLQSVSRAAFKPQNMTLRAPIRPTPRTYLSPVAVPASTNPSVPSVARSCSASRDAGGSCVTPRSPPAVSQSIAAGGSVLVLLLLLAVACDNCRRDLHPDPT